MIVVLLASAQKTSKYLQLKTIGYQMNLELLRGLKLKTIEIMVLKQSQLLNLDIHWIENLSLEKQYL